MNGKTEPRRGGVSADEPPTGTALFRNSAFSDLPPTVYFGKTDNPDGVFVPRTMQYEPVVLYKGSNHVVVKDVFRDNGFTLTYDPSRDFLINWVRVNTRVMYSKVKPYQKFNHIPRSGNLGSKSLLNWRMSSARERHADVFDFHSEGYMYPSQHIQIKEMIGRENNKLIEAGATHKAFFITKPATNSRGRGINLIQDINDPVLKTHPKGKGLLVQRYIDNPLLINGRKFDIRIYVLVTGVSPLRVYVFNDGIVRISGEKYVHPSDNPALAIHLTNTAVAIRTGHYVRPESDEGEIESSTWTLQHLIRFIKEEQQNPNSSNRYEGINADKIWEDIKEMSKRTLVAEKEPLMNDKMKRVVVGTPEMEEKCSSVGSLPVAEDSALPNIGFGQGDLSRIGIRSPISASKGSESDDPGTPTQSSSEPQETSDGESADNGGSYEEDDEEIMSCNGLPICHPLATYGHAVYDSCFEMFGFDYLVDTNGKLWLIEVNISPLAQAHSILDKVLKTKMFSESFNIVGLNKFCGRRFERAATGRKLTVKDLKEEKLKLCVDEFYRSIGTGWERAYPDNNPETLKLFSEVDPYDRVVLNWCLNPTFTNTLSTVSKSAKEALVRNEEEITLHNSVYTQRTRAKRTKEVPL